MMVQIQRQEWCTVVQSQRQTFMVVQLLIRRPVSPAFQFQEDVVIPEDAVALNRLDMPLSIYRRLQLLRALD